MELSLVHNIGRNGYIKFYCISKWLWKKWFMVTTNVTINVPNVTINVPNVTINVPNVMDVVIL